MKKTDIKTKAGYPLGSIMAFLGICLLCFAVITYSLLFVPRLFGYSVCSSAGGTDGSNIRNAVITSFIDPSLVERDEEILFRTESGFLRGNVLGSNPRDRIITVSGGFGRVEIEVPYGRYVGTVEMTIPYAGGLYDFYSQPLGIMNTVCFIISGFLMTRIGKLMRTRVRDDRNSQ